MKPYTFIPLLPLLATSLSASVLVKYDFDKDHLGNTITGSTTGGTNGPVISTVYPSISFGASTAEPRVKKEYDNATDSPANYYWKGWDGNMMRVKNHGPASGPGVYAGSANLADAVTNASYFAFTYNPTVATSFTRISFQAAARVGTLNPLFELPVGITVRSSLTGTANLAATSMINAYAELAQYQSINIDLTGFDEFQDHNGSPVTFYFYMDSQGTTARREVFIDNLTLEGIQAIPESTSLLLAACGATGLIARRRRAR
ncbi:hypothetical protein JIN84_22555 [Luteolibacter yonseiensis]|uniref:PEP-CTERM protein-sorting domain-containing protein n=1 Tax=Luteolibacter yonseiensis TaxID=1144680 RepID=A0A934R8T2_9BACT|nr:hypothetical protein [Luteolibacter yonseiensis]MBK1818417.1 hypothetical protein [Luteolibacter yonseiensis]